jgi:hypothetical protein
MTQLLYPRFGVDYVKNPDAVMRMDHAVAIMFEGMLRADSHIGDFTGVSLEDYFNDHSEDWINARRVINGTDRAEEIADLSKLWYAGLGGPSHKRSLRMGDSGSDVKEVQTALSGLGFNSGAIDGNFGQRTKLAVIDFQRSKKIGVDGEVGPQTRSALNV